MISGSSGSLVLGITCCVRDNAGNGDLFLWFLRESVVPNACNFLGLTVNTIFL